MSPVEQQVGTSEELNTAGEGLNPSSPVVASSEEAFDMGQDPIEVKLNINPGAKKPYYVSFFLRRPTFAEEEQRERGMPLYIVDAGKIDGADASSMTLDEEPANVKLFDKILTKVVGYPLQRGQKPNPEGETPDTVFTTEDGTQLSVLEAIPIPHKNTVINGLFPSVFEVDAGSDNEEEEFLFALGSMNERTIRQEIGGGHKLEDGTLAPPQYVIRYTFREPTEAERRKFRSGAVSALSLRTKEGIRDRRSTNLSVIRDLFDSLILRIEGATIGGELIDVRNADHRKLIFGQFKKGTIIKLFNSLEADLGN